MQCSTSRWGGGRALARGGRATKACPSPRHSHQSISPFVPPQSPRIFLGINALPLDKEASTSGRVAADDDAQPAPRPPTTTIPVVVSISTTSSCLFSLALILPGSGWASEGLPDSAVDIFHNFLMYMDGLGPAGFIVFIATVAVFECVPLLPTQPLSLASGLLFGPFQGALAMLTGVSLAATTAFLISRGVGRKLAERVIDMETSDEESDTYYGGTGSVPRTKKKEKNMVKVKLDEVKEVIENGGFAQQVVAVMILRLTPVVPFSASNYVLGLTPVQFPAFLAGTVMGMSVWSVLYASLGAGARRLLDRGVDLSTIFADLAEQATQYSSAAFAVTVGLGVAGGAYYFFGTTKPSIPLPSSLLPSASARDATAKTLSEGNQLEREEAAVLHHQKR